MTLLEFSAEFDILYNNIMSNLAPGLTEYEKSVFLTQAQEQLVIESYNGQYKGDPFEGSEEIRAYLQALIKAYSVVPTVCVSNLPDKFKHYQVNLSAQNFWFIVLESAKLTGECPCIENKATIVKPVSYDAYWSISRNPFKGPNYNRVLRINKSKDIIELISEYGIKEYSLTYLDQPSPIILENISNGMSINGISIQTECILPEVIHRQILLRAVQIAKSVWGQTQEQ